MARWLLEHALPADVREAITGDLDEVFQRDCRTYGLRSARRRYWSQTASFTLYFVVERWRDRRRGGLMRVGMSSILANVFRRPLAQVGTGVAVGCVLVGALVALSLRDTDLGVGTLTRHTALLLGYGTAMMGGCALACIGPVLRVFRVEPADVLRDDE